MGCDFVNHSASAHHCSCLRSSTGVVAFGTCAHHARIHARIHPLSAAEPYARVIAGNKLIVSGTAFLGPASVKEDSGLRACFMNLQTTEADIDVALDWLAEIGADLSVAGRG